MNPHFWWYVARASGLVGWGLLSASVLWGLFVSTRLLGTKPTPAWVLDLHRFLGGLALLFTGFHLLGLVMDSYVHFGISELLVPLASKWHPVAVAWGVVAVYLLVAVEGSSLLMKHLPRKLWRTIHRASFGLFALATIHGLYSGTDTRRRPAAWYASLGVSLGVLWLWRIARARSKRQAELKRQRTAEHGAKRAQPAAVSPAASH